MRTMINKMLWLACAFSLSCWAQADEASPAPLPQPLKLRFCVFDPIGAQGDAFANAQDLALAARRFNIITTLKVYTDEGVAAEDFKAGQCDGVALTTLRARQFNAFIGSVDSIGGVPSYDDLRLLLSTLTQPKLAPYMRQGPYEVIGVVPLGAAYVFVRDRSINSVEKAAGKKIAVLDWDKSQAFMVQQLGAQPVASDITNFGGKFNNGQVDIIVAPAVTYRPLELYRGLGERGAIYHFPLMMITASIIINRERLLQQVPDLDQRIAALRTYALNENERAWKLIARSEKNIDPKYWMELSPKDQQKYTQMMKVARLQLTQNGHYNAKMMHLLKLVRCKNEPERSECAEHDE